MPPPPPPPLTAGVLSVTNQVWRMAVRLGRVQVGNLTFLWMQGSPGLPRGAPSLASEAEGGCKKRGHLGSSPLTARD